MNRVTCPHCGKVVEVSQALKHEIEESIVKELTNKHNEQLELLKKDLEEKAIKKAQADIDFKLKDSQNELQEAKERNKKLQEQLLEMNKLIRELKEHNEKARFENQKRMHEELEKMREGIAKSEQEKARIEKLELEKKLDDMKKALEDAQRKGQQSSQQLQGEVLELDFESQLKECYPLDELLPVPKGIEGADVLQKVLNKRGQHAGMIIWEVKRTKAWSNAWTSKLRENKRQVSADVAVLVSDVLPNNIDTFGFYENVWVTCYKYAIPLAQVLRNGLFEVAIAKSHAANKDEKLEALYNYLTDNAFRHRFEAQVESINSLKNDLEVEQRSMIRVWKKREMQINRMRNNIASLYGELQGIMGPALPTIQSLDSAQLPSITAQDALLE